MDKLRKAWAWIVAHAVALLAALFLFSSSMAGVHGCRASSALREADAKAAEAVKLVQEAKKSAEKAAALEAEKAELDRKVAKLEAAHSASVRAIPPRPVAAVLPPEGLPELRAALVGGGLRSDLSLTPEEPSRVNAGDARKMFEWKAAADRIPAFEARDLAQTRAQESAQALIDGLKTDLAKTEQVVAEKNNMIGLQGAALTAREGESVMLRKTIAETERSAKWKVRVSFGLGAATTYGLGKLFKLF